MTTNFEDVHYGGKFTYTYLGFAYLRIFPLAQSWGRCDKCKYRIQDNLAVSIDDASSGVLVHFCPHLTVTIPEGREG